MEDFTDIVNHPRCISDEAAKAVASKGGVIGIHFGSLFNNPKYWAWQKPLHLLNRCTKADHTGLLSAAFYHTNN